MTLNLLFMIIRNWWLAWLAFILCWCCVYIIGNNWLVLPVLIIYTMLEFLHRKYDYIIETNEINKYCNESDDVVINNYIIYGEVKK